MEGEYREVGQCPYCASPHYRFISEKKNSNGQTDQYFDADFSLVSCNNCGLLFSSPIDDKKYSQIKNYFSNSYNINRDANYAATVTDYWGCSLTNRLKRWMRVTRFLIRNLMGFPMPGRYHELMRIIGSRPLTTILDIGCSYGLLISFCRSMGYQAYGVEPTRAIAEEIQKHVPNLVEYGFFPDTYGPLERYECILFIHVLMYLRTPDRTLFQACFDRLADGGRLIILANDPDKLNDDKNRLILAAPTILNFVGEAFLELVARDIGFSTYQYIPSKSEHHCAFHILTR